jgi:hypothetical protein
MPIYEFLCKHIGALISKSDRLFFHNSDDIFRRRGLEQTMIDIEDGWIVRADRIGVNPEIIKDDDKWRALVDDVSKSGIPGYNRFPGAGGDYYGIRRDLYFRAGGWRVAHGEWDLDAEFLARCKKSMMLKQEDVFYHLEHYTKDVHQHRDTPNRPPRIAGEQHPLIQNLDEIIGRVLEFNGISATK